MRTSALRSALAAIDNAETPDGAQLDASSSETIAGGVVGLGAAEVARRQLSDEQIRELISAEIDERLTAADELHQWRSPATCRHAARRGGRAHRPAGRCLSRVQG